MVWLNLENYIPSERRRNALRDETIESFIGRTKDPVKREKRLELFRVKDEAE